MKNPKVAFDKFNEAVRQLNLSIKEATEEPVRTIYADGHKGVDEALNCLSDDAIDCGKYSDRTVKDLRDCLRESRKDIEELKILITPLADWLMNVR